MKKYKFDFECVARFDFTKNDNLGVQSFARFEFMKTPHLDVQRFEIPIYPSYVVCGNGV